MMENQVGWRGRFFGWAGRQLVQYGGLASTAELAPTADTRRALTDTGPVKPFAEYAVRYEYFQNKNLYHHLYRWGLAEAPMDTAKNPVPSAVGFYVANVITGDLTVVPIPPDEELSSGEVPPPQESTALADAVDEIWEWSNFILLKKNYTRAAAIFGDSFLKVAERVDADGLVSSVYLQLVEVEFVRYCVVDERGIIQEIRVDVPRMTSVFGNRTREHILVEIWRKEWEDEGTGGVKYYEVEGTTAPKDEELPDPEKFSSFTDLGYDFIPIVWSQCDTPWWGVTDQIDYYNGLAWKSKRQNTPLGLLRANSVDSEGRPMPAPTTVTPTFQEIGNGAVSVVKLPGKTDFEWGGGAIDFAALQRDMETVWDGIVGSLPEYQAATLDNVANIAAETLMLLLNSAGQRVLSMRETLERALVRAQMMALTIGQVAGLPGFAPGEIGTYESGDLNHVFEERDVFEPTLAVRVAILKDLTAAQIPGRLALRIAQFPQDIIDEYDTAAMEDAMRQRTTLAAQLQQQQNLFDTGQADNGLTQI